MSGRQDRGAWRRNPRLGSEECSSFPAFHTSAPCRSPEAQRSNRPAASRLLAALPDEADFSEIPFRRHNRPYPADTGRADSGSSRPRWSENRRGRPRCRGGPSLQYTRRSRARNCSSGTNTGRRWRAHSAGTPASRRRAFRLNRSCRPYPAGTAVFPQETFSHLRGSIKI